MNFRIIPSISLLLLFLSLNACISNSSLVYLQNIKNDKSLIDDELISYEISEYRLQYNDIISIDIKTTVPFINEAFKFQDGNAMRAGGQGMADVYYMTGYTVDKEGEIDLPLIGKINVDGATLDEAKTKLQNALLEIVSEEIFVRVKLGGIRYSIFGEVNRPGKFTLLQDRLTIYEALSNAGDFTSFAKRNEVVILRQYPNGTKIHRVDLLDRSIIKTPYYFIQTNDQIYAEPLKQREFARTENASQNILLFSSLVTTFLLLLNFFN
ncbi:polysaccharide biosynthesis/export family protein [Rhodonellum sp.]|uniref:polysaccharide biosynthesis/export family protein n=1 Tax=Rhodonellum sp. TaxID=2231180 RepID=UPI00271BD063|nr:polysaccharide biosynthesis/export family protein [Rhodonellum sp.]MDO9554934.1 polysaccharide biosynthesis/export family protein [Rhodonellum sp.]